jgi:hypothetical protein
MRLTVSGLAVAAALASASAAPAGDIRGVVELFTSQGCSSCPPADRYLAELAKDESLVVLSWPVDYWDYIGWKDTFASPIFTARQKGYAAARESNQVYTPQAIIDGAVHAVGSDRDHVEEELANRAKALSASIAVRDRNGKLAIDITPKDNAKGPATLWLVRVLRSANIAIGRGENKGRSVTYTNVVREANAVAQWSGGAAHFDVARPKLGDGEGLIVLLQPGTITNPGPILSAARD